MTTTFQTNISEITLAYNPQIKPQDLPKISQVADVPELFRQNWNDMAICLYEEFKVAFLNNANGCLGVFKASQGGISSTVVDIRLIFAAALKAGASAMILCHNHPSGKLEPSEPDIRLTKKIIEGANLLDLRVLDHIILTREDYFSFASNGLMP